MKGFKSNCVTVVVRLVIPLTFVALLFGCAGKTTGPSGPVFFPPPPEEPHIQYLMGIDNSIDVEGKPSSFSLIATGGTQQALLKKIGKSYGIATHKGKLYVCSTFGGNVVVIDLINKKFDYLAGGESGAGALKKPINIAFDDNDVMYVVDTGRHDIVVFDAAGNFLKSFGKQFDGQPESNIVAVAMYNGALYAVDNKSNEIRVIDPKTGNQIKTLGKGDDVDKNLAIPTNIYIDKKGNIYVTNLGKTNIMKFDIDGNHLMTFGKAGDSYGDFARPKGVTVDEEGRIYIVDAGIQNVQVFNEAGRLMGFFGNPGLMLGSLNLPAGIAVTKDNLEYFQKMAAKDFKIEEVIFVINQISSPLNSFISIYGLGEMKK